jgi:hypothetical protein
MLAGGTVFTLLFMRHTGVVDSTPADA